MKNFIDADGSFNVTAFKEAAKNKASELEKQGLQKLDAISSNPFSSQSRKNRQSF